MVKSDIWHEAIEIEVSVEENEDETTQTAQSSERYAYESANYEIMSWFFAANDILSRLSQIIDVNNASEEIINVMLHAECYE